MAEHDYNPALIREEDWGRAVDERFVLQWLKDHVTGYLVDGKTYHPADVTIVLRSPTGAPNPVARVCGEAGHG
jgi:hypothetical protein